MNMKPTRSSPKSLEYPLASSDRRFYLCQAHRQLNQLFCWSWR